ncbi:MAG: DNA double-strand break repair nuclease NurA [Candidatus Aenigmarchaeota archaeon]|nr:DNA double-strand break repair nuclease NurA [Candidatus Aenigmarchaeota archaeon]
MQDVMQTVRRIVQRLAEAEAQRRSLAGMIRNLPGSSLVVRATPHPLDPLQVAAVDGGLMKKSLHGMDCLLVRAAAVCFRYTGGKVGSVAYFPSRDPAPRAEVFEALSEIEWSQFASLHRLLEEIRTAAQALEQFQPDLLLLDGMLLPHYLDKPAAASPLGSLYQQVLGEYRLLFARAREHHVALAGVVEDSRNTAFCEYLGSEILPRLGPPGPELELLQQTRDSALLFHLLERGERTMPLPTSNPVAAEIGAPPLQTFYLKTARFDRPLRVDFVPETVEIDALAGMLLAVSGQHAGYGMPAPIIEADQVARLTEGEMDRFYVSILSQAGSLSATMRLRRDQRPF